VVHGDRLTPSPLLGVLIWGLLSMVLAACGNDSSVSSREALEADAETAGAALEPADIYKTRCAQCHEGGYPKAPHLVTFQLLGRDAIYAAMTEGLMREHAQGLSEQELQALATHLGGSARASAPTKSCDAPWTPAEGQPQQIPTGWGITPQGTRFIDADIARLTRQQIPGLELKWAFAYPGATRARSQPVYYKGAVLVGSQDGTVYTLDLVTGCAHWTFKAVAEVRNAIAIGTGPAGLGTRAFFGDLQGNVYALDADTGRLIWQRRANDHAHVTLTGAPRLHGDRLYVPLSSTEWAAAADPAYPCCTFRGGVVAMDTASGEILWTGYSIPDPPAPTGERNSGGAERYHAAGAPIWNNPTIDSKRNRLYVGTGEAYTSPAAPTSDSVLAFDLDSGEMVWSFQATAGDAWNMACFIGGGTNCPAEDGPDVDFGASPMLITLPDGRDLVIAGQKLGVIYALDPDNDGALVWKNKIGRGGFAGGVHWGMAASPERIYAPNADTVFSGRFKGERKPGLFALEPATGEIAWFTPAPDVCATEDRPACDPGLSAAVTAIPGAVFAGAFDGHLRAYHADTGEILWDFNTNQSFETVSGEVAHGGSIEADGPVVFDGHVLVNSGYLFGDRMAGNVLLAFAPSSETP
jgi:polyvinyl alcohol dehydrogenase (cytochrome)